MAHTIRRPGTRQARGGEARRWLSGLLALGMAGPVAAASAGPRDETLEQLRTLAESAEDGSVRILVNEGGAGTLRVGDRIVYRFESERPGYLTAVHVDPQGTTTLLYPRADAAAGRVEAGQPIQLPGPDDGFELEVEPPIGRELLFAIVTDEPLDRGELGIGSTDVVVAFEPQQAPAFARRLRRALEARAGGSVRAASARQQIDGRGEVLYRSADIVDFFGERTRSIAPPRLDLQIQFATDSASLDDAARQNLDQFAEALGHSRLRATRFKVAGHTDDRGSEAYNLGLSERRAESVRSYLVDEKGIDAARLEIEAHGERNPLMSEESDYARRMNRRVEFGVIR